MQREAQAWQKLI